MIPRCLLEKPHLPNINIPTVPSCRACNEGFPKDEEYFLTVTPLAGFAPSLKRKVDKDGVVDRMLQRGVGLDAHFAESIRVAEDGRVFITPDERRIANVTRKTAFGLYCHRYTPKTPPAMDSLLALKPVHGLDNTNFIVAMAHTEKFQRRRWKHVQATVSPGRGKAQVFGHMFVRNWVWEDYGRLFSIMRFHETVWATVRRPNPPNRKNPYRRIGNKCSNHQEPLSFEGRGRVLLEGSDLTY